jgi:glycosyltransferase involved in cell wall biosynthesis
LAFDARAAPLRRGLAANGRRYVEANYAWGRIEQEHRDIVEQVRA